MKKYIKSSIPVYGAARKEVDVESFKASVFYLFKEASKKLNIRSGRLRVTRIKLERYTGPVYYEACVHYDFIGYESYMYLYEVPASTYIPEDYWCTKSYEYQDLTYLDILVQNIIKPSEFRENSEKVFDAFKQFVLDNNTIEGLTFDFFSNMNDINFGKGSRSSVMYYAAPNLQDLKLPDGFYIMKSKSDYHVCYLLQNDKIPQFSRLIEDYYFYDTNDCTAPISFKTSLSNLSDIDSLIIDMTNDLSMYIDNVLHSTQYNINYYINEGKVGIKVQEIEDLIKEKYPDVNKITIDTNNDVGTIYLYHKYNSIADFSVHIKDILNRSNEYILDKIDKLVSSKQSLFDLNKNKVNIHYLNNIRPSKYEHSKHDRFADNILYEDNTEDEKE